MKTRSNSLDLDLRRRDPEVILDYIREAFNDVYQNKLISDILPDFSQLNNKPEVIDYLLDHIRASLGYTDTRASMFGVDISYPAIEEKIKKMPFLKNKEINERYMFQLTQMYTQLMSGSVLRMPSAITNLSQILSAAEDVGIRTTYEALKFMNDKETSKIADEMVKRAGTGDLISSLSDMLTSGMDVDKSEITDGYAPIAQLLILQGTKSKFIREGKWYKNLFEKALTTRGVKGENLKTQVSALMDNTWEVMHGIPKGTLSEKELKRLMYLFSSVGMSQEYINRYVAYGLAYEPTGKMSALTFTGAELFLRKLSLVSAAMHLKQNSPSIFKNREAMSKKDRDKWMLDYPHEFFEPAVLEVGRANVYNTMFGMTQAYYAKYLRGAGKSINLYKSYQWRQILREQVIIANLLISYQKSIEYEGIAGLKRIGRVDKRAGTWFLGRGLGTMMSLMTTLFFPVLKPLIKTAGKTFSKTMSYAGLNPRATNKVLRSAGSPLIKIIGSTLIYSFYALQQLTGMWIDEEEEETKDTAKNDLMFMLFPMFVNQARDLTKYVSEDGVSGGLDYMSKYIPFLSEAPIQSAKDILMDFMEEEEE
jgi:hypothetical protein